MAFLLASAVPLNRRRVAERAWPLQRRRPRPIAIGPTYLNVSSKRAPDHFSGRRAEPSLRLPRFFCARWRAQPGSPLLVVKNGSQILSSDPVRPSTAVFHPRIKLSSSFFADRDASAMRRRLHGIDEHSQGSRTAAAVAPSSSMSSSANSISKRTLRPAASALKSLTIFRTSGPA